MNTWFRVHNDILENPKLLMLAPSDRWYFLALLSLKSQGVLDQFKGDKLKRVVVTKLRLTVDEWDECARRLQEENLLDKHYQPVGWEDRQFKSDSSTSRVRKHREKKRAKQASGVTTAPSAVAPDGPCNRGETFHVTGGVTHDETFQEQRGSVFVTPPDTEYRVQSTDLKDYSEPKGSAAGAGQPSNSSRLITIEKYYDAEDQGEKSKSSMIFGMGVRLLSKYQIPEKQARAILGMYKRDHEEGPLMDALAELYCRKPTGDPVAYLAAILKNPRQSMPKDWEPNPAVVNTLEGLGIPRRVVDQARAFFKLWIHERDISSDDFDGWFLSWCKQDFEDACENVNLLSGWYRPAAQTEFREPA